MKFIVKSNDLEYVNIMKDILKNRLSEIYDFFNEPFQKLDTNVYIYDSIDSLINGLAERGFTGYPEYMSACQIDKDNSINYFVPKDNAKPEEWSKETYKRCVFHELVHAVELKIYGEHPEWLTEGIAKTLDGTYGKGIKHLLVNYVNNIDVPEQREILNEFGEHGDRYDSYDYSYLMVSYLREIYGQETFLKGLRDKEIFDKIYSDDLLKKAVDYYNKKYDLTDLKIKFKKMTEEDNIKLMLDFNKNFPQFDNLLITMFPELSNLSKEELEKEKINNIKFYINKKYNDEKGTLDNAIKKYQDVWKKYNCKYVNAISKYLNVKWPKDIKSIEAMVGFLPIFPRFLDDYSFAIDVDLDEEKMLEVVAHEVLHFLWFVKWKQLFPETKREEMDSPYPVWEYSEMVTDAILNSPEIKEVHDFNEKSYNYFYDMMDEKVLLMEQLKEIYRTNDSIENKIIAGYNYVLPFLESKDKTKTFKK